MSTAAGLGEIGRTSGRDLLFRLTEALCELSCLEDQAGRNFFARVLADQLNVQIDLRGTKQREDVIALAQAALSVPAGTRVLVDVVRVFEGAPTADALEPMLSLMGEPAGYSAPLPGPLTEREVTSALALLDAVEARMPTHGLRDELAVELHLDLPLGLTLRQLFTFVLNLNVQPDGLPPAVLLMEHAALLARSPGWQQSLSNWAHSWAVRTGLVDELECRRGNRVDAIADPSIPRCLVVAVEPAGDCSGDIVVRPWLNTVPGHWQPQPADPRTTSLDGLGSAVERALRQVLRISPAPRGPAPGEAEPAPPYVEFVLPYELLNHDVAGLTVRSGDGKPLPLGLKYGVHLRSLERMRTDDGLVRAQWRERWSTLQNRGIAVHGWRSSDSGGLDEWQTTLAAEPSRTAAVLDAPDGAAATEALKAAIAEGIGLAVWDRRGDFPEERREVVAAVFAAVQKPGRLPVVIHQLRRRAELNAAGPALLGRHIAFFWDDPNRLVDIQVPPDFESDTGHGLDHRHTRRTMDSEETPV
ncbi:hypothetical protein JCM4814A_33500 [Streptomyces phaeofaciens JCM 4814]|uniref:Uncharacterized protein n=1 Tax=Streptomyces phaeofaciens TaxID=68254 RepID=A0A918LY39_9ACTN|nr:hypothetical protein [Streptomyces phaeofaciens]GGT73149.1 hypothetical protein GCM10010226_58890 [Streptomyces phaeofaciens]